MSIELTITAKGQVTLRRAVLDHLSLKAGDEVPVALLRDARVELAAAERGHGLSRVRAPLRRHCAGWGSNQYPYRKCSR